MYGVTYLDAVLLLKTVVEQLQRFRRIWIVADLHELDAELASGDSVRLKAPRGVDDDRFWVVRCGSRLRMGFARHTCDGLTRDAVGDHNDAGRLGTLLLELRDVLAEDFVELLAGRRLACQQ